MKKLLSAFAILCSTAIYAGTIVTSVNTFPSFGNVYPFHSSTSFFYLVSGSALTGNILITAPPQFEVSLNYQHGYSKTASIVPIAGNVAQTKVYVRFSPSAVGAASGNVIHTSPASTSQNISVSGTAINWAIPASYYNTVNTQRGAALKSVLYNKILGHTAVSYTPGVWNAFATTDVQPNGKVWDIYSTRFDTTSPYVFTLVTDQDNGSGGTNEGEKYNREHSFPQSWFAQATPMVSDLHHIFATDKKVNNTRNNFPFGNVTTPTFTSLYGGKLGPNTFPGYTSTVFEPNNEYKGDLARAYFYMATRYENLIAGWQANGNADDVLAGNAFPSYDSWQVNLLLSWHNQDPVSDKEIKRNNAIYAIQNNRNPFIDSPQFIRRIWGGSLPNEPTIQANSLQIVNNNNTSVTLNWAGGNGQRRLVLVRAGNAVNGLPIDTIQYGANANLSLAPQTTSGNSIVYNGTGSTVTITNMQVGVTYHYAIIEYNGWYTATNYNTIGYATTSGTTLPVSLVSFNVALAGEDANLVWATATEKNNHKFEIERATEDGVFKKIGEIKGKANSNQKVWYRFNDQKITEAAGKSNLLYYRLKQIDFDGKFTYSPEISLNLQLETHIPALFIAPNPFGKEFAITIQTTTPANLQYTIAALDGTILKKGNEQVNETQQQFIVDNLNGLPAGIYILQVELNGRFYHYKIAKNQ